MDLFQNHTPAERRRSKPLLPRQETTLHPAADFHRRLTEDLTVCSGATQPLSVLAFQVPRYLEAERQQRRAMEIALRLGMRCSDLRGHLVPGVLVLGIPAHAEAAASVAQRVNDLLAELSGQKVISGMARYPFDGTRAVDLLRLAAWRSLSGSSGCAWSDDLEWLLGSVEDRPTPTRHAWAPRPPTLLQAWA